MTSIVSFLSVFDRQFIINRALKWSELIGSRGRVVKSDRKLKTEVKTPLKDSTENLRSRWRPGFASIES
jgi:hypothetical protein